MVRLLLSFALLVHLFACGGDDGPGSDGGAATDVGVDPDGGGSVAEPTMPPLYRMRVTRSGSAFTLEAVEYLPSMNGAHRPLVAVGGEHLLVARSGTVVVDVVPVQVPTSYVAEGFDEDFTATGGEEIATTDGFTDVFVDASEAFDTVELVAEDGTVVASLDAMDLTSPGGGDAQISQPFPAAPWVELLGSRDFTRLPSGMVAGAVVDLPPLSDAQRYLAEALELMTPRLRSSVTAVGIAPLNPGVVGIAYGGVLILSDTLLDRDRPHIHVAKVFAHEAAHTFTAASAFVDFTRYPEWRAPWPNELISSLEETHREFGFERDVRTFWATLHETAVQADKAVPYLGADWSGFSEYLENGFVNDYAGSSVSEDIANTVEVASLPSSTRMSPTLSSDVCNAFVAGEELDSRYVLLYIKLRLVEQLGLVHPADLEFCLKSIVPTEEPGLRVEGNPFDRELNAGYTSAEATEFVIVAQDADERGIAIELTTRQRRPLGLYALDNTWWGSWDPGNSLVLASSVASQARTAARGLVVITYADSDERVDGLIFDLALQNAFGTVTSYWDYIPFRIPL